MMILEDCAKEIVAVVDKGAEKHSKKSYDIRCTIHRVKENGEEEVPINMNFVFNQGDEATFIRELTLIMDSIIQTHEFNENDRVDLKWQIENYDDFLVQFKTSTEFLDDFNAFKECKLTLQKIKITDKLKLQGERAGKVFLAKQGYKIVAEDYRDDNGILWVLCDNIFAEETSIICSINVIADDGGSDLNDLKDKLAWQGHKSAKNYYYDKAKSFIVFSSINPIIIDKGNALIRYHENILKKPVPKDN